MDHDLSSYLCPMRFRLFLILFLQISAISAFARFNPFELRHRLSNEELQQIAYSQRNPFELIRGDEAREILAFLPSVTSPNLTIKTPEDRRYVKAPGLLFWIYLALFFFLSLLINLERHLLVRMVRGMFNDQLASSLMRDKERSGSSVYLSWYLFFFMNAGIFMFQISNWWTKGQFPGTAQIYLLWFSAGIFSFYVFKHLLLNFIGAIFPLNKPMQQYSFSINLFNALLGLMLFPVNVGLSYTDGFPRDIFLLAGLTFVTISFMLRVARGLLIGLPYLIGSPIHFFLYLCAVELAPVLIIVKLVGENGLGG